MRNTALVRTIVLGRKFKSIGKSLTEVGSHPKVEATSNPCFRQNHLLEPDSMQKIARMMDGYDRGIYTLLEAGAQMK